MKKIKVNEQITDKNQAEIMEAMNKQAKYLGITSYFFAFPMNGGANAQIKFENLPLSIGLIMMTEGFKKLVTGELAKHPEFSDEYKKIFLDVITQQDKMLEDANKKVAEFIKSKKK